MGIINNKYLEKIYKERKLEINKMMEFMYLPCIGNHP